MNSVVFFSIITITAYILTGVGVLKHLLSTRFLRPLTNKEMLNVILTWPMWLP